MFPEAQCTPDTLRRMARFHADVIDAVSTAIARDAVVVVGMAQNPFVKKARKALDEAGITYTYLEYGSYFSEWKKRLAVKLWTGWATFPQIFVKGTLIGGHAEVVSALGDGSLRTKLDA
jgi:glutaredoxin-related protein